MSLNSTIDDAELKSRLAKYGISCPITNTTRKILFMKLQKLEMESVNKKTNESVKSIATNSDELMVNQIIHFKIKQQFFNYFNSILLVLNNFI